MNHIFEWIVVVSLSWLCGAYVAILPVTSASQVENRPARPNILFIAVGDLADWCGCLAGHPDAKTPNIDRLAKRGVLFTNAYCVSPICGPSRAAVLTGMRPETTCVYTNQGTYSDSIPEAVALPLHSLIPADAIRVRATETGDTP